MEKLKELKQQYESLSEESNKTKNEIKQLESHPVVAEYKQLLEKEKSLGNQLLSCYKELKFEEYSNCEHILVCTHYEYDGYEGRSYRCFGCIKCGLDTRFIDKVLPIKSYEDQIQYDYQHTYHSICSNNLNTIFKECDLSLAQSVYSEIKELFPYIDDNDKIKELFPNINNKDLACLKKDFLDFFGKCYIEAEKQKEAKKTIKKRT